VGEEVPQIAIGVHQANDADLGAAVRRRGGTAAAQVEAFEKGAPIRVDQRRIALPARPG